MAPLRSVFYTFWISLMLFVYGRGSPETLKCIEEALIPSLSSTCKYPSPITSSEAIRQLRDKWIVFMGESTLRQLFLQFLGIIKGESFDRIPDKKGEIKIEERLAGSRYTFYYYEYYNNLTFHLNEEGVPKLKLYDGRTPDLLILNDGLHDLLYSYSNIDLTWNKLSETIQNFKLSYSNIQILWIPSSQIHDLYLTKHRKTDINFNNVTLYNKCIIAQYSLYKTRGGYDYYYNIFKNISFNKWNHDGIHSMERARYESEGLIRIFYYLNNDINAWENDKLSATQIMTFIFYGIIFAIVIICQLFKILFYKKKNGHTNGNGLNNGSDDDVLESLINNEVTNAETIIDKKDASDIKLNTEIKEIEYELQLPPLLENISLISICVNNYILNRKIYLSFFNIGICLILLYLFDGPKHLFILPSLKIYSRDFFIFLHIIFLLISYLTFIPNESKDSDRIVSRLQTEEWKGIMQIIFVMYHYFDASEIYNLIRVFIGAYVWMTGFGNTSFFLKTNCFNLNRLFGMLFRLNWLVFWVCLLLNQPLMLYYICPLHTFFFLFVYCIWGCAYKYNDMKYIKEIKLLISGLLLCLLFETPQIIFNYFWYPLSYILSLHGTLYEWHFRTSLDHYATWLGMIFAVYFKQIYNFLIITLKNKLKIKIFITIICIIAIILWYNYVYKHNKYIYNSMHPYTESIPIFTYIILRNLFDKYRSYYSKFLAWMGQITLETYIFQYHLYMINDAKSILTIPILIKYPLCNFIVVSCFYIWISRVAFDATNTIRNALYPPRSKKENQQVLKETIVYCVILITLYIVSYIISLSIE
eukprot:405655_1